ncbi:S9 family peptidase [bacterium]|nr:S9 family peptidase [bacterium]MCI0603812.1 S9 family peptidase [bacterium]
MKFLYQTFSIWALLSLSAVVLAESEVQLIPRKVLFGNPVKDKPMISPSGMRFAYLAPSEEGILNIWVASTGKKDDRMVTQDQRRGIFDFQWGYSDDYILFFQDNNGDENHHLKVVNLRTGTVQDLTPFAGVRATNLLKDDAHPEEVMIGLNLRDHNLFDMYRVNLNTGAVKLEAQNPGDVIGWTIDRQFTIRAATAFREDLSTAIRVRDGIDKPWRDVLVTPFEKTPFLGQYNGGSLVIGFSSNGNHLYAVTSMNNDTTQLVTLDAATGKILDVIAVHPLADLWEVNDRYEVLLDKKNGRVLSAAFDYLKPEYRVVDKSVVNDFKILRNQESGVFRVFSRDALDTIWIVQYISDVRPNVYYLYSRATKKAQLLMVSHPEVDQYSMSKTQEILIPARDGMKLVSFLSLPVGTTGRNLPMMLSVHGGPWGRDEWRFDPEVQWLTNRGYAVLQVNFRGSTGFGVKYMNAGNGQWCKGSMQNDLTDAVRWAINQGIADPKRIGISGASYGGYATLCGIVNTPELYVGAIDMVGPSDVGHLLSSFPSYWKPVKRRWIRRIGVDVESDPEANEEISPLYHVDKIRVPLMIGHGSNDPRVKQAASDRIVEAMRKKNLPVDYVVYPDEGHGLIREANILDFYGRAEEFLARHLKGRFEPRSQIKESSVQLR